MAEIDELESVVSPAGRVGLGRPRLEVEEDLTRVGAAGGGMSSVLPKRNGPVKVSGACPKQLRGHDAEACLGTALPRRGV